MTELAAEWLRSQKLRIFSDRQVLWQQADSFAKAAHETLDLTETAFIVANEGRRLIGCDRVSVAIKRGGKCRVHSISGQDTIENRSNIVAALNKLATRVVAAGEPLWHDGSTEDLPPRSKKRSKTTSIILMDVTSPSYRCVNLSAKEEKAKALRAKSNVTELTVGEIIGALIVEQIESDIPPEIFHARVDLVYEHGTRAIANSLSHSSLFMMPVWRTLGRMMWLFQSRTLPKSLGVMGLIVIAGLALAFVPLELELESEGTLEPDVRREVFAPIDGEVSEVLVDHNSQSKRAIRSSRSETPSSKSKLPNCCWGKFKPRPPSWLGYEAC